MDSNQPAITYDESVAQVVRELPSVVRNYIADDKHMSVIESLSLKYRLQPEQKKTLTQETVLVMTGVDDPDEFTDVLNKEGRVDVKTAQEILNEISSRIFVPLNEQVQYAAKIEEEKAAEKAAEEAKRAARTPKYEPVKIPLPDYKAAPLQSPRYVRPEATLPNPTVAPLPPKVAMPRPAVTLGTSAAVARPLAPQPITPEVPKPEAVPAKPVAPAAAPLPAIAPQAELPVGEEAPKPVPPPVAAPVPTPAPAAPVVLPVPPAPAPAPQPVVAQAPAAPKASTPQPPPAKSYAADPYREPIDENDR